MNRAKACRADPTLPNSAPAGPGLARPARARVTPKRRARRIAVAVLAALPFALEPTASAEPPAPFVPPPTVAPAPSPIATVRAAAASWDSRSVVLGARIGMGFPQVFSQLRNFGVYEIEGGYVLPFWGRRLQIGAAFAYSEPGAGNGRPDPRLGASGADYRWDLSQRELTFEVGFILRAFAPGSRRVVPYGRVGFRLYLLDTVIDGQAAGSPFGRYDERFTESGLTLGGGIEVRLGPGALTVELRVDWSDMNRHISGDSNTGMLSLLAGYRFFL